MHRRDFFLKLLNKKRLEWQFFVFFALHRARSESDGEAKAEI